LSNDISRERGEGMIEVHNILLPSKGKKSLDEQFRLPDDDFLRPFNTALGENLFYMAPSVTVEVVFN
jgi:hypothetical protein